MIRLRTHHVKMNSKNENWYETCNKRIQNVSSQNLVWFSQNVVIKNKTNQGHVVHH